MGVSRFTAERWLIVLLACAAIACASRNSRRGDGGWPFATPPALSDSDVEAIVALVDGRDDLESQRISSMTIEGGIVVVTTNEKGEDYGDELRVRRDGGTWVVVAVYDWVD